MAQAQKLLTQSPSDWTLIIAEDWSQMWKKALRTAEFSRGLMANFKESCERNLPSSITKGSI